MIRGARTALSAYLTVTRRIGIGIGITAAVVAVSAVIVAPIWFMATRFRAAYNVLMGIVFVAGIAAWIIARVRRSAREVGTRAALSAAAVTGARVVGWIVAIVAVPLFVLGFLSVGASIWAVALIIIDLGCIGLLLTTGHRPH